MHGQMKASSGQEDKDPKCRYFCRGKVWQATFLEYGLLHHPGKNEWMKKLL
jgi:hypothetical protein